MKTIKTTRTTRTIQALLLTILLLFLYSPAWATVYYCDLSDPGGNTASTGLWGDPFVSIVDCNDKTFSQGDDLYFLAGAEATVTERLNITWDGNSGDRAIIGAYDGEGDFEITAGQEPVLNCNSTLDGVYMSRTSGNDASGYVTIQDLEVTYSDEAAITIIRGGPHCIVQRCYLHHTGSNGIMLSRVSYALVYDNTMHDGNLRGTTRGGAIVVTAMASAATPAGDSDYCIVRGNTIYDFNEGIFIVKKARYFLVEDNIVYDIEGPAVYTDAAKYGTIRNNILYFSATASQRNPCIEINNETSREYCYTGDFRIYGNFMANGTRGINISNNYQNTTSSSCTQDDIYIYNNTIVDCDYNIFINDYGNNNWSGNYVYNNISYQTDYPISGGHFNASNPTGFTFSKNYFNHSWFGPGGAGENTAIATDCVVGPEDNSVPPIAKSSGWSTIAAGAITWSAGADNYLTAYFGLVLGVCVNAATNLTDVNDTGGSLEDVDTTNGKWFYGGSDDPLDNYTVGTDEVTLTGVTGNNIQWTGAKTIADNDLIYYRHFYDSAPDIGADEYGEVETSGLKAEWQFEDTPGILIDSTDGNYDLTDHNTVVNAAGKDGESAVFNGTNQYLSRTGAAADFNWSDEGTVCGWIYTDAFPGAAAFDNFFSKGIAGSGNFDISMTISDDGSPTFYTGYDGTQYDTTAFTGANLIATQWYHICAAINSTGATVEGLADDHIRIRIWDADAGATLGGADYEEETALAHAWLAGQGGDIFVGSYGAASYWDGMIDNLQFYNKVLSSEDMDALSASAIGTSTIGTFSHCDSAGSQVVAETTYSAGDTCYLCVKTTDSENMFFADGPLGNLQIGTDMAYPSNEEFEYHSGIGTDTLLFYRVIQVGDRDLDLQAEGTADDTGLVHGATKLTDVGGTEITYTLPQADPSGGNIIITGLGTATDPVTIGATGTSTTISALTYQLANEVYQYLEPVTDDVDITVNGVTITGIGRSQLNTGTLTFTGNNNHVRCVRFSGGVTDVGGPGAVYGTAIYGTDVYSGGSAGSGNTYHPVCQRGKSRMGMNPN